MEKKKEKNKKMKGRRGEVSPSASRPVIGELLFLLLHGGVMQLSLTRRGRRRRVGKKRLRRAEEEAKEMKKKLFFEPRVKRAVPKRV